MKLLLIRHADPDYENDSLTEKGHLQANLLAEHLKDAKIDEIYVSPMGRAQLTAGYVLKKRGVEANATFPWLAELSGEYMPGLWAWGKPPVEILEREESYTVNGWPEEVDFGPYMKPVTESLYSHFDEFMKQQGYIREGFLYTAETDNDKTVAFFCHGGLTVTLLAHLLQISLPASYASFGCDPSSVTQLDLDIKDGKGCFRLMRLNDVSHAPHLQAAVLQK